MLYIISVENYWCYGEEIMSNSYWKGIKQAKLTRSQITASWAMQGVDHSETRINFVNRVFYIYYQSMANIRSFSDENHKRIMLKELEDAATTGWGTGIDDLEEAFEHLCKTNGLWTDDDTKNYYGGPNKVFNRPLITDVPTSIVNFADAVDSKMEKLSSVLEDYKKQVQDLEQSYHGKRWKNLGTALKAVKKGGEVVKPFLWFAPPVETRLGQVVTFTKVLSNIHKGLTTYSDATGAHMRDIAPLLGVIRTTLGWVPVLGNFYGKAVEIMPGLVTNFRTLIEQRVRRLDAISHMR